MIISASHKITTIRQQFFYDTVEEAKKRNPYFEHFEIVGSENK
jgi:hypothetical protein